MHGDGENWIGSYLEHSIYFQQQDFKGNNDINRTLHSQADEGIRH